MENIYLIESTFEIMKSGVTILIIKIVCYIEENLTANFSTWIVGRADGYRRNIKFIPTPTKIPYSTPITRHRKKVANIGIKSFLLDFHMSFTTSYSIM